MKFLADESVDHPIVARLREDGHDVTAVCELDPGIPDALVFDLSRSENAILLTADKDFGFLAQGLHNDSPGIVLIRLAGLSPSEKARIVSEAVADHGRKFEGASVVISHGSIRIRTRPSGWN